METKEYLELLKELQYQYFEAMRHKSNQKKFDKHWNEYERLMDIKDRVIRKTTSSKHFNFSSTKEPNSSK